MRRIRLVLLSCLLLSACAPIGPTKEQLVQLAVAATLSSLPRNTAAPTSPPVPTPTPLSLSGLYCEYQFCIGHPVDMPFYDANAAQNQQTPSTYSRGILSANNSGLFILIIWQDAPGITDPQFMLDLIMQYGTDTRSGSVQPKLMGSLNVFYVDITPTAASTLPYGGAAAWTCGGRAFAWKAYTPQPQLAPGLLTDALARFRCQSR